jgi:hypothetical protein
VFAPAERCVSDMKASPRRRLRMQIDDAWMAAPCNRIGIPINLAVYKRRCMLRIDVLNQALRNVPEEQLRYPLRWG